MSPFVVRNIRGNFVSYASLPSGKNWRTFASTEVMVGTRARLPWTIGVNAFALARALLLMINRRDNTTEPARSSA